MQKNTVQRDTLHGILGLYERQRRTKPACRLCAASADEKSVGTSTTHSLCGVACAERDFQPAACRCQPEHLPVGVENTVADDTAEILGEVLRGIGPVKTF